MKSNCKFTHSLFVIIREGLKSKQDLEKRLNFNLESVRKKLEEELEEYETLFQIENEKKRSLEENNFQLHLELEEYKRKSKELSLEIARKIEFVSKNDPLE